MKPPRAAVLQAGSNGADEQLVALCRAVRPQRRWWWGVRTWCVDMSRGGDSTGDCNRYDDSEPRRRTGAWCYLCDKPIATWSSRWPVPEIARLAIRRHRTEHIKGRLDTPPQEMHA